MKKKKSLNQTIVRIALLPMLLLTIIITFAGSYFIADSLDEQVRLGMIDLANTMSISLYEMYPGDYHYEEKADGIHLYKGEHEFNSDYTYIDKIKASTECDISISYMQYSVISTFRNSFGEREIGFATNDIINETVLINDKSFFYDDASFNNESYYCYCTPLHDADSNPIGMLSVFMPSSNVKSLVWRVLVPIIIISLVTCVLISLIVLRYANKFIEVIRYIEKYMKSIADGDFKAKLNHSVIKRDDELGQMGDSAYKTAMSLKKMVEEDLLTSLYNRRSADKHFSETLSNYVDKGVKFCVALGDIDFFKKVNDTYGHEAGDLVLIAVSSTLKKFMMGKGYAVRWGGEEFLLIFEGYEMNKTKPWMEDMLNEIRALEVFSEDRLIKVTMTFGLLQCDKADNSSMDRYINAADNMLYYGKEHGRNQLVTLETFEAIDEEANAE